MKKLLFVVLTSLIVVSCGPSMNATWQKPGYTPSKFKKMLVIAISNNLEVRTSLEGSMISELREIHPEITYVAGTSLLPPNVPKEDWTEEKLVAKINEANIDAVMTAAVVSNYTDNNYVQGTPMYPAYYYGVGPYLYNTYSMIYSPGYYDTEQVYVLESNLYDLSEGSDQENSLVWKGQSDVRDPGSVYSGARSYAKNLASYISQEKVF